MAELIRISPEGSDIGVLPALASVLDDPGGRRLLVELNGTRAYSQSFFDSMQHISWVLGGEQVTSREGALQAVGEAARILTSRKAMVLHFVALNMASVKRLWRAVRPV
jgi:hypothetical protein